MGILFFFVGGGSASRAAKGHPGVVPPLKNPLPGPSFCGQYPSSHGSVERRSAYIDEQPETLHLCPPPGGGVANNSLRPSVRGGCIAAARAPAVRDRGRGQPVRPHLRSGSPIGDCFPVRLRWQLPCCPFCGGGDKVGLLEIGPMKIPQVFPGHLKKETACFIQSNIGQRGRPPISHSNHIQIYVPKSSCNIPCYEAVIGRPKMHMLCVCPPYALEDSCTKASNYTWLLSMNPEAPDNMMNKLAKI